MLECVDRWRVVKGQMQLLSRAVKYMIAEMPPRKLDVLVACEFSGTVRDAFAAKGHYAVSCDMLPSEKPGLHYQGDVFDVLGDGWDLVIAHPPCTYLTVAANKWMKPEYRDRFPDRQRQREEAFEFFMRLYNAPVGKVAVENPIGVVSSMFRKPDQVLQPYQFGHPERKATCLWLRGLPKLTPTNIVPLPEKRSEAHKMHYLPPSPDRWKLRSVTYQGIAQAMADQWG